jgi:outer membrane protein OmpA-like peptidoglycan-associated protein
MLEHWGNVLRDNPRLCGVIHGHADHESERGADPHLGLLRARGVKDHLVGEYAIEPARLHVVTYGTSCSQEQPSRRERSDRRVSFAITDCPATEPAQRIPCGRYDALVGLDSLESYPAP